MTTCPHRFLLLLTTVAGLAGKASATTYFVATTGNNANPGTSEPAAWATISYAATHAISGDIIHVKAGNYGNETATVVNSGTSNTPIRFEGYRLAPGDIASPGYFDLHQSGGPPVPVLDANRMPLFNGIFDCSSRSFVEIRHFQIGGGTGVYMTGADHVIIDDYLSDGCSRAVEIVNSTSVEVLNTQVKNASIYPYHLRGSSFVRVENCTSLYVTTDADYHFVIEGYPGVNAQRNTMRHCYAEGDATGVHGIGIKGETCFDNLIEDCVARNFSNNFYVRHHNIYSNTFQSCVAYGGVNGFVARDGAHDNRFLGCATIGAARAFTCFDSSEDKDEGSQRGKNTYSCEGNIFLNCTFRNASQYGILFNNANHDSPAANNLFDYCVFEGGSTLILHQTSNNYGNLVSNSRISGYAACETHDGGSGQFAFFNNTWLNNGFPAGCGYTNIENPPALSVTWVGQSVALSWPVSTLGWVLQATTNLSYAPVPWTEIPPPYQTNGNNLSYEEAPLSSQKYYRLHRP